ncbi:alpha-L-fucosidase [Bacteroidota bacterium]
MKLFKNTIYLVAILLCSGCGSADKSNDSSTQVPAYDTTWESLMNYECPEWFLDAKFGIYTHWGPYSVPAWENEWYPRLMYSKNDERRGAKFYDYHRETWGDPSEFGYKDFVPLFTAEKFDANEWADLFKKSGARFAGPVAQHHDGFAMWDSKLTVWDAMEMGPNRDIVGELAKAIRERDMKFVTSFHHAFHWKYYEPSYDIENSDTKDPEYAGINKIYPPVHEPGEPESEEFLQNWLDRVVEVIDKYQPDYLWYDFGWRQPGFEPYKKEFLAYYYNQAITWGKDVVVTYKNDHLPVGVAVLDLERGQLDTLSTRPWITDTSVGLKSWSYIDDPDYKSVNTLVDNLIDRVSKNGNLLLNIGPRPDGSIPEEQQELLLGIGAWLAINGEAIYETRPWVKFGEGPTRMATGHMTERQNKGMAYTGEDLRFTRSKDGKKLYVIALDWPGDSLSIRSLGTGSSDLKGKISKVSYIGNGEEMTWEQKEDGLLINLESVQPEGEHAYAWIVEIR